MNKIEEFFISIPDKDPAKLSKVRITCYSKDNSDKTYITIENTAHNQYIAEDVYYSQLRVLDTLSRFLKFETVENWYLVYNDMSPEEVEDYKTNAKIPGCVLDYAVDVVLDSHNELHSQNEKEDTDVMVHATAGALGVNYDFLRHLVQEKLAEKNGCT